ncbi:MAG TPA: hypothetical protein VFN91_13920, partial [Myxococcaceae bacterium]|nr:hypothetical protein [Myxococcaceae bacterium]
MPETVFINDDQLELEIAAEILRRGAGIVVGRLYERRTYDVIRDLDGFARSRTFGAKQYFVIHPSFSKRRLLLGRIEKGFYIRQRYGGPALDLFLGSESSDDGGARLFYGSIHFYPTTLRDGAPPERAP